MPTEAADTPLSVEAPLTVAAQIEARAEHPIAADRVLLMHDERRWTYKQYRDECVRMAHLLLGRLGRIDPDRPGHVAMMLENHLELMSLLGGCSFGRLTLFGVNTGLRGEILAGVLNHSRARVLVVDEKISHEVERVRDLLKYIEPENILVLATQGGAVSESVDLLRCMASEIGPEDVALPAPDLVPEPTDNLMVIYTSGTTGLPKGINNNNAKLLFTGMAVSSNLGLTKEDVGYGCMPLFHSNSLFVGFFPAFTVGGAMGIRERFSASRFVEDVQRYGTTFWNYVGEPVHYVLSAISNKYGADREKIKEAITNHPQNRMRYAVGNGAAPPDIDRFSEIFGLEDMFELYGSTEAAISTFRRKGDPRGTVGEILDPAVKILSPDGQECPPAQLDADGTITNYEEAVGEICRQAEGTGLFQGYFDNQEATSEKYRDGTYHSGDLGHVLVVEDRQYLYFDGRTADWIRKDGENFSASQVGRLISEHPDIPLAVAYGVPCAVSDELVMVAVKLRDGASFDPQKFFDWCEEQVQGASMDRKWVPDFVLIVEDFVYTETQKVLVRNYKKMHFNLDRIADAEIYWRERGDTRYKPFTPDAYRGLRKHFEASERLALLDR